MGAVTVELNPAFASTGEIEEKINDHPGWLDLDPFHDGDAWSWFNLFVKITVQTPDGDVVLHNKVPKKLHAMITEKPPGFGDVYESPDTIPLFGEDNELSGFSLGPARHVPRPVRDGAIHGRKFEDLDADGVHDDNEPYLDGWTIILFDEAGNPIDRTVTMDDDPDTPEDETGWYWFPDLPAGHYTVGEILQDGWLQTLPMAADDPAPGVIEPGFDLFMTDTDTTTVVLDLSQVPGAPSGPPITVQLEGVPFGPGGADTIVERLGGADLSGTGAVSGVMPAGCEAIG